MPQGGKSSEYLQKLSEAIKKEQEAAKLRCTDQSKLDDADTHLWSRS